MISGVQNLSLKSSRTLYVVSVVSLYSQDDPIVATLSLCLLGDSWPLSLHCCAEAVLVLWDGKRHSIAGSAQQTQDIGGSLQLLLIGVAEDLFEESGGLDPLAVGSPSKWAHRNSWSKNMVLT